MKYDQTEQTPDVQGVSADTRLLTEVLNRLDALQNERAQQADNEDNEITIDLEALFYYLLSKAYLIVIGAVIGALLLGFYVSYTSVPIYSATSKLYIVGQSGINILSDLQIGSVLTMDYQEVFQTWEVHQLVNEELGTNFPYSQLQSMITVTNPEDTRILYITAHSPDPQLAADVANAYATSAQTFIMQTMDTDEPRTFSIALVPSVASTKSVTTYLIIGFLLGTVVVAGVLLLLFLLDNRPKSPDDILRYGGIPTLAVIPQHPELSGDNYKKRRKRNK